MFAICIESSHARGMGHLFRMLTLADALKRRELSFRFLLNSHAPSEEKLAAKGIPYDLVDLTNRTSGWETQAIATYGISVWINDRLDTRAEHARQIKQAGLPLVTFNDRGSGASMSKLHFACLAGFQEGALEGEKVLTSLDYLILNPEIEQYRRERSATSPLLVTLGGTDTYGVTLKVVEFLRQSNTMATVIVGPGFEHLEALHSVTTPQFQIKQNVPSLIHEMGQCNLAVTGGGMTVFEALACGLPCIVVGNEPHEVPIGEQLEKWGVARFAGFYETLGPRCFTETLDVAAMSRRALQQFHAHGVERVIDELISL